MQTIIYVITATEYYKDGRKLFRVVGAAHTEADAKELVSELDTLFKELAFRLQTDIVYAYEATYIL